MCSIFGYCGVTRDKSDKEKAAILEAFMRTKSRGPDDTRTVETESGLLAFHRLSIMDLTPSGMQPFSHSGDLVVCNGEIYGYGAIRAELESDGYRFSSDSDCEVLLPMYRKFGTDMFAKLDAEFACIIYDAKSREFIAARDPIGIRPLYFGQSANGDYIFASEPKNLIGLTETILPFPPGCYFKSGKFVRYSSIAKPDHTEKDDLETACAKIREKLIAGVKKRLVSDAKVGFLLSGGLDSSLVCAIAAKQCEHPIRTFAIGMNTDAIDLKYARRAAEFIGSDHTEVYMTEEDVISNLEKVVKILATYDITTIRASIGMYLVCKAIHEKTDVRVLLTGEISDELFGYKYTDFAPSADAFQKESEKRIAELHMYDVLRADRCISVNSLEARVPFGDLDFVKYVLALDPELKMNRYGKGKFLLRHAFDDKTYLPDDILWREKAAFSDAVGHSMVDVLKAYAEKVFTDAEFEEKKRAYADAHAAPFTKESLLYRELFEKHYPGQAKMIDGFWMPNKAWKGCDVDDPSARVLSNYGDSGK